MKLRIDLNEPQILKKVTSDKFGLLVSHEWKRLINPYTPRDTGLLEQNVTENPFSLHYRQPYAVYVYNGEDMQFQKNNPYSTDHWDKKAAQAGQLNKLYRTINNALQSGRF